ncbi:MAG: hypothetical protein OK474_08705 [Thaumarchaeota archaeon]|nr:hypothetical protein [Nitrososphaerota archaeon]
MSSHLAYYSTLMLAAFVLVSILITFFNPLPFRLLFSGALLANVAGFVALLLIAATGVMMLFRRSLLRRFRDPDLLKEIHVWVAALGGAFLIIHVVFLLFFPVTLPVLYGYVATYFAFVIWVTGLLFMEGLRSSLFYHALLSLVGVSLIVLHVFTAGRDVPITVSGIILVLIASVVLGSALRQLARLSRDGAQRRPL